ncbi:unnamed protein product [Amaranthus hypochondriacus]
MFYSQCLLSSKGPLGAIWVAGYFFKRLKKRQITDTDICSSVDKILLEGLPSVTYRILAYLLLGVVRIYSKKVEYLFQDCHETVSDINRFSVGKKKLVSFRDIVRSSPSIILPERYELDSFQLEVEDVPNRHNNAPREDINLRDIYHEASTRNVDAYSQYSSNKQPDEDCALLEDLIARTLHEVTMHKETCSFTQTPDKVAAKQETSTSAHTPPDKVLSPHQMGFKVEVCSPDHMKDLKTSKEKLRELRFSEEDDFDVERICALDVELLNLINDYQAQTIDNMDEDDLKKAPLEYQESVILKEKEIPSSIEKTRDAGFVDAGVGTIPELMVVPTPAKKEIAQRLGKRKCSVDEITMLSNEIMKQGLKDASSLVCKRRRVAHTILDLWRLYQIPALSKNFSVPLIPCVALEKLEDVHCGKKAESTELLNASVQLTVKTFETTQAPGEQHDAVNTNAPPSESRSTIAPGTPVLCPTSARVFATDRAADSDGEDVHFHENMRMEFSVHEEDHLRPSLMAEMDVNEADSGELHENKNGGLSARTRTVARYLMQVIQRKKQQGVEAVSLLPIAKRKNKRENAMLFFELLVLSSRGLINVKQEEAYGDVILRETPKLEASLNMSNMLVLQE